MSKSIVIYFSRAGENYAVGDIDKGNTEVIAEMIQEFTNADLFKIEPKNPYSHNYKECCDEALLEQKNNARPELKDYLDNIDVYDEVYIGSPIYWGTMPQSMFTQLEMLNFNNKSIKIFTTHEGSGLGNVVKDVQSICEGGTITDTLAIKGTNVYQAKTQVEKFSKKVILSK
ncbi:MAG: NAD(P)H-dependent oxidoreductase [Erysipelotrichaceae bacterium]|nr:NAD(P)H-dependent oxidoreductase [Erysipelotrichaceae bacterium]